MGCSRFAELQSAFITQNPYRVGEKQKMRASGNLQIYDEMHIVHDPEFRKLKEYRGFYDVFLFDLAGHKIYSVRKESDFATSLKTGLLKAQHWARSLWSCLPSRIPSTQPFETPHPTNRLQVRPLRLWRALSWTIPRLLSAQ